MHNCLVSLHNIRCNLDRGHSFQHLNWQLQTAQQWAVLGRNGSGKTALARLLGRQIAIASGELCYADDFNPSRDIAYVSFELQQNLCQRDQHLDMSELSESAFDAGTTAYNAILQHRAEPENFGQLCHDYGLDSLLQTGIRYLSSGEMRKVLILRALLEQAMKDGQQTLLLTRRKQDVLGPVSHILLMDQLDIVAAGPRDEIIASRAWRDIFPPPLPLPASLPAPDPARTVFIPEPDQALIEAHNLCASFQGKPVLQNIDFCLGYGEHIAISGPNSCGKSTLLNLVSGENHKAYGQDIKLFGRQRGSGETLWQVKSRFGVVSNAIQARYIRGWNTLEVVISGFYDSIGLYQDYAANERKAALDWLDALQVADTATQRFHTLSYGQQRMALLARAMVTYQPILILDEACTGLDDYNREWVLRMVDHIAAYSNTQLIYVSHLSDEIPSCINRELVFQARDDGSYRLEQVNAKPS
jgi:molybdate transport system ATP-binding protein